MGLINVIFFIMLFIVISYCVIGLFVDVVKMMIDDIRSIIRWVKYRYRKWVNKC